MRLARQQPVEGRYFIGINLICASINVNDNKLPFVVRSKTRFNMLLINSITPLRNIVWARMRLVRCKFPRYHCLFLSPML
jgi:hypothetical protein